MDEELADYFREQLKKIRQAQLLDQAKILIEIYDAGCIAQAKACRANGCDMDNTCEDCENNLAAAQIVKGE
jgi:hypothetical protein